MSGGQSEMMRKLFSKLFSKITPELSLFLIFIKINLAFQVIICREWISIPEFQASLNWKCIPDSNSLILIVRDLYLYKKTYDLSPVPRISVTAW